MVPVNFIGVCIALILVVVHAVEWTAEFLNMKSSEKDVPEDFKSVYDPARYDEARRYSKAKTRLSLASSVFGLAILFVFWFAGGFDFLDLFLRARMSNEILRGLAYIVILAWASDIMSLPFSVYSTFVLEERFGFNKTTPGVFILDRLKIYFLTAVLGGPLLAGILFFFQKAGPWAWVYAWAAAGLFGLFVQFVAPTWIMPLFNKFTPLADGDLRRKIFEYAKLVSFPLTNIFVMDGSKRSAKTNAFFTGFGKNKRIALFDTLIEKHTAPEMVAVLAHEIGHYKMKHILRGMILSVVQYGVVFFLLSLFLNRRDLFGAFGVASPSAYAGLVLFSIVYSPLSFLISIGMNAISRKREYEADRYAVDTAPEPESLLNALKTLSVTNLSTLTPHPFYVFLTYSHPPLVDRLAALRAALKNKG